VHLPGAGACAGLQPSHARRGTPRTAAHPADRLVAGDATPLGGPSAPAPGRPDRAAPGPPPWLRTSGYLGSIVSPAIIAITFRSSVSDHGLHLVRTIMAAVSNLGSPFARGCEPTTERCEKIPAPAPDRRIGAADDPAVLDSALRPVMRDGRPQVDLDPNGTERRLRARKLRQRRWRCVTDAADRGRHDNCRLCPCQLRAGELCAVRGKAPLLIRSGAASHWDCHMGVQLGFMRVQLGSKSHLGRLQGGGCGAGTGGRQREASLCFPDDQASGCGCRGPALRAPQSRLTVLVVSAGHMPGPASRPVPPPRVACGMRARPIRAVLAWTGDRSPFR